VQTVTAIGLLAIVLAFAVARPARLPEAAMAVPAAVVAVLIGLVSWSDAWSELSALGPTVGFLAAILVYTSPWGGNYPRLQLLTVGQLLESKQFEYPHLTGGNVTHRRHPAS
jgi:hypothetical protein